jgi:hypothetical protein
MFLSHYPLRPKIYAFLALEQILSIFNVSGQLCVQIHCKVWNAYILECPANAPVIYILLTSSKGR